MKTRTIKTADEDEQLTDCRNLQTGKPMTLKELRMEIAKGFDGEPVDFDMEEIRRMGRELSRKKAQHTHENTNGRNPTA